MEWKGNDGIEEVRKELLVGKFAKGADPPRLHECFKKINAIINDRTKQKLELAAIDRLMLKVENFTRFAPMSRKFLIDVAS